MKLLGALLLTAAFAAMGLTESLRLRRRARLIADFASGLELLRAEIVSRLAPMPEAAERLALHGPESTRRFYAAVSAGLENLGGAEFSEIWSRALGLCELSEGAKLSLLNLGGSLGRYGAQEQSSAILACEAELGREALGAAEQARVMGRLRAGLALGGGLILAIVLY